MLEGRKGEFYTAYGYRRKVHKRGFLLDMTRGRKAGTPSPPYGMPGELPGRKERKMLEMKVRGLTLDPLSNMALVILRDLEGSRALPIWVGIPEANAIALEI